MADNRAGVVTGYVKLWPREVFYIERGELVKPSLNTSGVYILYPDLEVFYVGKSGKLFGRLSVHARKRYVLWNHFSAFLVPPDHLAYVEAIVIAATNSEANKAGGKRIPHIPPSTER